MLKFDTQWIPRTEALIHRLGLLFMWANALLLLVIIAQVTLRYGFSHGLVALEELQWHLYAFAALFAVVHTQLHNRHVRVDLFLTYRSANTQRVLEIIGLLFLFLPFVSVVFYHSLDFVADAWRTNEHSTAPSGLPWRWLIKGTLPAAFGLLIIIGVLQIIKNIQLILAERLSHEH